jgi:hypothetical protein
MQRVSPEALPSDKPLLEGQGDVKLTWHVPGGTKDYESAKGIDSVTHQGDAIKTD